MRKENQTTQNNKQVSSYALSLELIIELIHRIELKDILQVDKPELDGPPN
jgi:hypothetical protein